MEQRMIAFEDSSRLQMQQFFQEKRNAMRLFYTVKDQLVNNTNEIELKQKHTSKATRNRATRI